ncbi:MAG: FecR family protein [Muribaculaceae bacterium]
MDRRVNQYFAGELSNEERKSLLKETFENDSLRQEFIEYRQLQTLINLQPHQTNAQEGEDSFSQFISRRKWALRRKVLFSAMRYAAVLVIGVCFAWWYGNMGQDNAPVVPQDAPLAQTLTVPAGQRAHITLPDGSRVWVNAGSKITYASAFGNERRVTLEGEAFFEVATDSVRPFIVKAGKMNVKALGTKFNVYNYASEPLVVSLVEGKVKVYRDQILKKSVVLNPGERAVEIDGDLLKEPFGDDVLMWCDGIYSFQDQPLKDILRKLELYYDVNIVVNSQELLNKHFTGKFRQDDGVMEVLRILQKIHPFQISHADGSRNITINEINNICQ